MFGYSFMGLLKLPKLIRESLMNSIGGFRDDLELCKICRKILFGLS